MSDPSSAPQSGGSDPNDELHWPRDAAGRQALRSVALRSEAFLVEQVEPVLDGLGPALRFACPQEPTYRSGNLLLLPTAPGPNVAAVEARFDAAFADLSGIRHRTVAWDDPRGSEGAIAAWEAAGYAPERVTVRSAGPSDLRAPATPEGVRLRPALYAADWAFLADLPFLGEERADDAADRHHVRARLAFHRRSLAGGAFTGGWWIADLAGTPAAGLGLAVHGGLARFQQVVTAPEARRRGLASWLVHQVAARAFADFGAHRALILAEENSGADRLYARLGFQAVERSVQLTLIDRDARRASDAV